MLADEFAREGFKVLLATNGKDGVEAAVSKHPDLIVADLVMPGMDGIDTIKKIREDGEWGKEVPIIVLSNLGDADKVGAALQLGAFDYLVKTDWKIGDVVIKVKEKLHIY